MIKKASNRIPFILLLPLILLLNGSCSDKKDFELYFKQTGLELQDPYEIDSLNQQGVSDWTLKAYITITEKDKKTIINKLRKERKFHSVANEKFYVDNFRLHRYDT